MGIFSSKDKNGNLSVNLWCVDGIPGFHPKDAVTLTVDKPKGKVVIVKRLNKKISYEIDLSKVVDAKIASSQQLQQKDKSVVGRAAVGALLAGPLGAMIGGMSGVGTKTKSKKINLLLITYLEGDTEKAIALEVVGASIGWQYLPDEIMRRR